MTPSGLTDHVAREIVAQLIVLDDELLDCVPVGGYFYIKMVASTISMFITFGWVL